MKRFNIYIILLFLILIPFNVFATGGVNYSASSITVTLGNSKTLRISSNNVAGRIDFSVADSNIATIDKSNYFLKSDGDGVSLTVTGKKLGTTTITITNTDVSTFDYETITGSKTIKVTVIEPSTTSTTQSTTKITSSKTTKKASTTTKSTTKKVTSSTTTTTITTAIIEGLDNAKKLVEDAENSLISADFNSAFKAVNGLKDCPEKEELLKRLTDIKPYLLTEKTCENCDYTKWIVFSGVLLLFIIGENIYLVSKRKIGYVK